MTKIKAQALMRAAEVAHTAARSVAEAKRTLSKAEKASDIADRIYLDLVTAAVAERQQSQQEVQQTQ